MEYVSSTQDIAWFRDRYWNGTLIIKPPFQRKPVWVARQKCWLVESVLLRLPIPEIYIQQATSPEGETTFAVVDGQQRVRTLLQFVGSEKDPTEAEFNKFVLDKLPEQSKWYNATFSELSDPEKSAVWGYQLGVRLLKTSNDDDVRDMFRRLNKFLSPLRPQELRNATYGGAFLKVALKLADDEYWAEQRIVTTASIRRMADVEFISELLIGTMHGPEGGSAKVVDRYYEQYEDYDEEFPEQPQTVRLYSRTLGLVRDLFPNIKDASRWGNKADFYSLFVGLASLLRDHEIPSSKVSKLRAALLELGEQITAKLTKANTKVSPEAATYARAVEKGSNEKSRRGERHDVVVSTCEQFFASKKAK